MTQAIIIDATNAVLGRLASFAAKQALFGKPVVIVNCSSALLLGRKKNIIKEYKIARAKGSSSLSGPHFPKEPQKLIKRTIRGMLPYKQERGRLALKRVICHNATPPEYENSQKLTLIKPIKLKTISLKELSSKI